MTGISIVAAGYEAICQGCDHEFFGGKMFQVVDLPSDEHGQWIFDCPNCGEIKADGNDVNGGW
jgi:predicted RNA-binding Zn-ribbon protein involved in translation (DUF1610 family)